MAVFVTELPTDKQIPSEESKGSQVVVFNSNGCLVVIVPTCVAESLGGVFGQERSPHILEVSLENEDSDPCIHGGI